MNIFTLLTITSAVWTASLSQYTTRHSGFLIYAGKDYTDVRTIYKGNMFRYWVEVMKDEDDSKYMDIIFPKIPLETIDVAPELDRLVSDRYCLYDGIYITIDQCLALCKGVEIEPNKQKPSSGECISNVCFCSWKLPEKSDVPTYLSLRASYQVRRLELQAFVTASGQDTDRADDRFTEWPRRTEDIFNENSLSEDDDEQPPRKKAKSGRKVQFSSTERRNGLEPSAGPTCTVTADDGEPQPSCSYAPSKDECPVGSVETKCSYGGKEITEKECNSLCSEIGRDNHIDTKGGYCKDGECRCSRDLKNTCLNRKLSGAKKRKQTLPMRMALREYCS